MDGVGNGSSGIMVVGATNMPWQLDAAIRRRFQRRIYIGLPDAKAWVRAFQIHMGELDSVISLEDYNRLGDMTEGCSRSDISNIMQDAPMMPVKMAHTATHYRKVIGIGLSTYKPR